jgi:hypothetical protein
MAKVVMKWAAGDEVLAASFVGVAVLAGAVNPSPHGDSYSTFLSPVEPVRGAAV